MKFKPKVEHFLQFSCLSLRSLLALTVVYFNAMKKRFVNWY